MKLQLDVNFKLVVPVIQRETEVPLVCCFFPAQRGDRQCCQCKVALSVSWLRSLKNDIIQWLFLGFLMKGGMWACRKGEVFPPAFPNLTSSSVAFLNRRWPGDAVLLPPMAGENTPDFRGDLDFQVVTLNP